MAGKIFGWLLIIIGVTCFPIGIWLLSSSGGNIRYILGSINYFFMGTGIIAWGWDIAHTKPNKICGWIIFSLGVIGLVSNILLLNIIGIGGSIFALIAGWSLAHGKDWRPTTDSKLNDKIMDANDKINKITK